MSFVYEWFRFERLMVARPLPRRRRAAGRGGDGVRRRSGMVGGEPLTD